MFRRHRAGGGAPPLQEDDDDDDEDDPFNAMARKKKRKKAKTTQDKGSESRGIERKPAPIVGSSSLPSSLSTQSNSHRDTAESSAAPTSQNDPMVASTTSSMKRHHKSMSNTRKAKMDSMLAELQFETTTGNNSGRHRRGNHYGDSSAHGGGGGSHVEPGQEHLTTNIFVGNMAPNITEEELSSLFGKFGELYSVKIMWPRTAEERARGRLTGFVCFYNRSDAEDAMEACSEVDAFSNGRRLMLRWGKNVLREQHHQPRQRSLPTGETTRVQAQASQPYAGDPAAASQMQSRPKIQVKVPADKGRARFISMVASFVAKDGTDFEQMLLADGAAGRGLGGHDLRFLTYRAHAEDKNEEHIFYKWRVWAFAHGDGEFRWRTQPFVMFAGKSQAKGECCLWVPPPIDSEAARQEEVLLQRQKEEEENLREERRRHRRPEPQRKSQGQQQQRPLSQRELDEFNQLTRQNLCASREAIASAMSFCFEKCAVAAPQICDLLRDLLMQKSGGVSVESRIARLYLLSDILFNSQQPGVRNAFIFRDAIEQMAPAIFESLGSDRAKRMQHNKMQKAVSAVLAAWTNWSVYNPSFLDELQAKFEGRTIEALIKKDDDQTKENDTKDKTASESKSAADKVANQVASTVPLGDWKDVEGEDQENADGVGVDEEKSMPSLSFDRPDGEPLGTHESKASLAENHDAEADGEPLGDDADGEPLGDDADGEPLGDDADGEPLGDDADGEPLGDDAAGEPLGDDPDGEPLERDEDADGEPLDTDGDDGRFDDADEDGEPL